MSSKTFLGEASTHQRSAECRAGRHRDCEGFVPKKEWNQRDKPCTCGCNHQPPYKIQKKRITLFSQE